MSIVMRGCCVLVVGLMLLGCAHEQANDLQAQARLRTAAVDETDPYESFNRASLDVNTTITSVTVGPIAKIYTTVVPPAPRQGLSNVIQNMEEPTIFINDILQGRFDAAKTTLGRFMVNSTIGVGGLFDVGSMGGLPRQTGDFGQTLYVYGVSSGPFVIMPILGPSNPRDAVGFAVNMAVDPTSYAFEYGFGRVPVYAISGFTLLDSADQLQDVQAGSVDYYQRLRSAYIQKRQSQLLGAVGVSTDTPTATIQMLTTPAPPKKPGIKAKRRIGQ